MYTVEQLRDYARSDTGAMLDWAADEIERLQKRVSQLEIDKGNVEHEFAVWRTDNRRDIERIRDRIQDVLAEL